MEKDLRILELQLENLKLRLQLRGTWRYVRFLEEMEVELKRKLSSISELVHS